MMRQLAISFVYQNRGFEMSQLLRQHEDRSSLPLQIRMMDIELQREWVYSAEEEDKEFSAEEVLQDLAINCRHVLEGLMVHLPENPASEYGWDHVKLLEETLVELPSLTQLGIRMNSEEKPKGKLLEDIIVRLGKRLADNIPQLVYINVYWLYWQVFRRGDGSVVLEELDSRERRNVELFRHSIFEPMG